MIYLCAAPGEVPSAHPSFPHTAHAACHLERNGALRCAEGIVSSGKDLLLFTADEPCFFRDMSGLCREIKALCIKHGLQGVAANLSPPVREEKLRFLSLLSRELQSINCRLFIPEEFGDSIPTAAVFLPTAMSGGIFKERLAEAIARFGRGRLALDLERLMMDFTIPAPTGVGTPLSPAQFRHLAAALHPAVFFSRELCAKYFTCRLQNRHHLILFDDASTLMEKMRMGKELGISHFFFSYPDISDIFSELNLLLQREKPL